MAAFCCNRSAWYRNNAATEFNNFGGTGRLPRRYRRNADCETPSALAIDLTVRFADRIAASSARLAFFVIRSLIVGIEVKEVRPGNVVTQIVTLTQCEAKTMRHRSAMSRGSPAGNGADGIRTHDPLRARQVLSHLSYRPRYFFQRQKITQSGFEPNRPKLLPKGPIAEDQHVNTKGKIGDTMCNDARI